MQPGSPKPLLCHGAAEIRTSAAERALNERTNQASRL